MKKIKWTHGLFIFLVFNPFVHVHNQNYDELALIEVILAIIVIYLHDIKEIMEGKEV